MKKRYIPLIGCVFTMVLLSTVFHSLLSAESKDYEKWEVLNYTDEEKPTRGGYLCTASSRDVGLLNPNHWPVNDWVVISHIHDALITAEKHYLPHPWLVEDWSYPNPQTCTLRLRQNVVFHDGTPFNAAAVKYQMEWIRDPQNGCWSRAWVKEIASIEAINEHEVSFRFDEPWAPLLGILRTVPGMMMSPNALRQDAALSLAKKAEQNARRAEKKLEALQKRAAEANAEAASELKAKIAEAVSKAGSARETALKAIEETRGARKYDTHPVGAGPYMFEDRSPGNWIKLKRNPNWWFGRFAGKPEMPYFDGIQTFVIPDPSVRLANLKTGKIHLMSLSKLQYKELKDKADSGLTVMASNGPHVNALRFNLAKGPCRDIRVRKAISHAIDRQALIHGTQFGLVRAASCMYPGDHWCHNPRLDPVPFDPGLSKKLLAEVGFKNDLIINGYMSNLPEYQAMTEALNL